VIEKVKKYLQAFLFKKHFVFRFQYYEHDTVVNDTNVVEYEFINVGSRSVDVNNTTLIPVALGPLGSPIGDIFSRMKLAVNYNEEDTTIYRIKFPIFPDCEVLSHATLILSGWNVCPVAPIDPDHCEFSFGGNYGPFSYCSAFLVNCFTANTQAKFQALIDANTFVPELQGKTVVTFIPTANPNVFDIKLEVTNVLLPCGEHFFGVSFEIFTGVGCLQIASVVPIMDNGPVNNGVPKLLVISKVKAGLLNNP